MFFEFDQNNSGGGFCVDDRVCHHVIVEADTATQANEIAERIGIYFNGVDDGVDCECCGDRWYPQWDQVDGLSTPMLYGKPIEQYQERFAEVGEVYCRIYYKDGSIKEYRVGDTDGAKAFHE